MNNLKNKILIILAITIWSGTAHALPQGAHVAAGNSTISQPDANAMHINQTTDKAIIDWQAYSINANEAVRYFQPGSGSISLNRVTGADPSLIYGQLSANGQVWVINPNGLLIGPNANINVGGFLGSTLNITDQNFLSGNYTFSRTSASLSSITNQGNITANNGGYAVLISPSVANQGNITANSGAIGLASGDDVTLAFANNGLINLTINKQTAADSLGIDNSGTITADGGQVIISAKVAGDILKTVVNNQGIIQARSISNQNGVIRLEGGESGIVAVSGILDASGKGANETGGSITITGQYVGLFNNATLDVSGDNGGGTILIGGDYQGKSPLSPPFDKVGNGGVATATYVDKNAVINADAITSGNGGKVIVWSNDSTRFYGTITAKGGSQSGDGGFVETSGHYLDVAGAAIDASAANGKAGQWLLDPWNVTIGITASAFGAFGGGNPNIWTPSATGSNVLVTDIATNLATADVTITTTGAGAEAGNITWNSGAALDYNGIGTVTNRTLTLQAANNIVYSGTISDSNTGTADKLNVVFNADRDASGAGNIVMNTGSSITTNGGNITFGGGADPSTTAAVGSAATVPDRYGIYLNGATLNAGAGNISLRGGEGVADVSGSNDHGIFARNGTAIQTSSGNITINGRGGKPSITTDNNIGVVLDGAGTAVQSVSGIISITGQGTTVEGSRSYGIYMASGASVRSTGTATITMNGTGAGQVTLGNNQYGVYLTGADTTVQSVDGAISLTGTGGGTNNDNFGIYMENGARVTSTGAATITLNGTGGAGANHNSGVELAGAGTTVSSVTGATSITGTGGGTAFNNNYGIEIINGAGVTSTGAAPITLDGRGTGADPAAGIITSTTGASNTIGGASSTGTITLTANTASGADSISLSGLTIQGTGNLVLQPLNVATTIGIAGGAGTFNLDATELGYIQNGFNNIIIGRSNGTGTITTGAYTFSDNLTLRGASSTININGALNLGSNNLTLNTGGTGNQTAAISAAGLELLGTGGTYTLTNTSNAITTLAGNTGTVSYSQPGSLAVGTVNTAGLTASNTLLMRTTSAAADFTLNNTVTANGTGDALVLAAGRNFINNAGATPLSATNGRYLVYSTNPAQNTFGSFISPGNAFGRTYASNPPGHATISSLTGSRMIYSITPSLTITADAITRLYGDVNPALTYVLTGLVTGDSVSGTLSTTATQTSNVGTYPITQGTLAVDSNLGYSTSFTGNNLTVNPAPLTLTANTASRLYGDANPAFSGAITGFKLTDTLASATTGILTFTSTATVTNNVGSYGINGSGLTANNGNYTFAQAAGNSTALTINPTPLTITADDKAKIYGDINPALTASYSGFKNSETSAVVSGLTLATAATTASNVGAYAITASGATASNYTITQNNGSLTVNPAPLTITADDKARVYGDTNPALTASYSGFKNSETSAVVSGLTLATAATTASNVGAYAITASGATASNYTITQNNGSLTVNPAPLTITADDKTKVYRDTNPALTASYSGFKNGETSAVVSGLTLATAATTASNVGTYAITASGATASNYAITHRNGVLTVASAHNHDHVIQEGIGTSLSSSSVKEPVPQAENKFEGIVVITSEFPYISKHTDLQPLAVNYKSSKACLTIGDGKYPMIVEVDCK